MNIQVYVEGHCGYIVFANLPHNSLTSEMLTGMANHIDSLAIKHEVKVIIVRSEGQDVFCAGANFEELTSIRTIDEGEAYFMGFSKVIYSIINAEVPVIVGVQGRSVGGGLGLIAAADYCIGTHRSTLRLTPLSVGIGPFMIVPALIHKVGMAVYSKLMFESMHWHTAEWAHQVGLYQHIVKNNQQLEDYISYLVDHIRSFQREALVENKSMFWKGQKRSIWDQMCENARKSARLLLSAHPQQKLAQLANKA